MERFSVKIINSDANQMNFKTGFIQCPYFCSRNGWTLMHTYLDKVSSAYLNNISENKTVVLLGSVVVSVKMFCGVYH